MALELAARLELRCSTGESPIIARLPLIFSTRQWLDRTDNLPFGWRVSTVHGVVFSLFCGRGGPILARRRGRRPRIDSPLPLALELNKRKGPVANGDRAFS